MAPREEASEHTHKGRSARNTVIGDDAREFEFGHVFYPLSKESTLMGAAKFVGGPQIVELRVTLGQTASMPSPDAAARHTGAGVARRQAHHERMRDERAREAAAGDAELPPEDDAVEMASAVHVLDCVAEVGPNYTLLRSKETKAKRRKRQREDAYRAIMRRIAQGTSCR